MPGHGTDVLFNRMILHMTLYTFLTSISGSSSLTASSFLTKASHAVTSRKTIDQNRRYPPSDTRPYSRGVDRKYLFLWISWVAQPADQSAYENSKLLNDKKTVKARALPMPRPIVWAVEAYDKFWGERRVSAQPDSSVSHILGQAAMRTVNSDV